MEWTQNRPARRGWRVVQRFYGLMLAVLLVLPLCGCASPERRPLSFEPPPEESWLTARLSGDTAPIPGKSERIILPGEIDEPRPLVTLAMKGCSIKDRFDRSTTLAYNFADGQNRLEFKLNAKGPSFSDPGRLELKGAGLRFVHKLQKIKSPKEKCRFESPVQGLVGSIYNEFYLRQNDTVFQELHAKGVAFWE